MDYLQWHKTQWRVRRVVPPALVAKIGKRTLLRSTGTADYDRAVRIARPIIREFDRIIDRANGRTRRLHIRARTDNGPGSSDWLTPRRVFDALQTTFDQDVASAGAGIGWVPAAEHITSGSLEREWRGFIWCNPPFGLKRGMGTWIERFVEHGDGLLLLSSNSYTSWWQRLAPRVDLVLFVSGYLNFVPTNGKRTGRASFGSCLFAIGDKGVVALQTAAANGFGTLLTPGVTLSQKSV